MYVSCVYPDTITSHNIVKLMGDEDTKTSKAILHTVQHGRRRRHPLNQYLFISICST